MHVTCVYIYRRKENKKIHACIIIIISQNLVCECVCGYRTGEPYKASTHVDDVGRT